MGSQLILNNHIANDEWQLIEPPKAQEEVKKQAGKVVIFKITGEASLNQDQIEKTTFPKSGKIILPIQVLLHHQKALMDRIAKKEIGIWIETHEEINSFH